MIDINLNDPILNAYMLFLQTADAVQKYADVCFYRKANLSTTKFIMLHILAANEGTMMPSQVARWMFRERHNITTLVDRMQRDGLVRSERNAKDRRLVNIELTDKGRNTLARAMPVAREIVGQVMSSIDESNVTQLMKLLNLLRQSSNKGLEHLDIKKSKNF